MAQGERTEGTVEASLPKGLYRITCDNGRTVTASLGGVARQTTVKVIPGDRVIVELSPFDPTRGRIRAKT